MASGSPGSKRSKKAATATATTGVTAVSREQDLGDLLRWAGEEIGVKAPKLKGGFVDGLRGACDMSLSPLCVCVCVCVCVYRIWDGANSCRAYSRPVHICDKYLASTAVSWKWKTRSRVFGDSFQALVLNDRKTNYCTRRHM